MKRNGRLLAVVLACAVPLSACTTTHFYGEYHPRSASSPEAGRSAKNVARAGGNAVKDVLGGREQAPVLATGHSWVFLWGTLDTGSVEVDDIMSSSFKDKTLTNMEVEDRISLAGVVLWVLTAGIFSHHTVIVRGDVVEPTPPPTAPASRTP